MCDRGFKRLARLRNVSTLAVNVDFARQDRSQRVCANFEKKRPMGLERVELLEARVGRQRVIEAARIKAVS